MGMLSSFRELRQRFNVFPTVQANELYRGAPQVLFARTTADNTYNNTATLANISELTLTVEGGRTYILKALFPLSIAAAANNIQFSLAGGTCTATLIEGFARFSLAAGTAEIDRITALNTDIDGGTTSVWTQCELNALLVVNAEGTLVVQASQVAAAATNSVVRAGSYIALIG